MPASVANKHFLTNSSAVTDSPECGPLWLFQATPFISSFPPEPPGMRPESSSLYPHVVAHMRGDTTRATKDNQNTIRPGYQVLTHPVDPMIQGGTWSAHPTIPPRLASDSVAGDMSGMLPSPSHSGLFSTPEESEPPRPRALCKRSGFGCNKEMGRRGDLTRHEVFSCGFRTPDEIESAKNIYRCQHCRKSFCRNTILRDHVKLHSMRRIRRR